MKLPTLLPLLAATARAALQHVGVDWSSLLHEERSGISYTFNGAVQPLEKILVASGVDTVRQRIWVNPADGNYDLAYNLELARRAKAAGLKVYLDFHYSDNWADPGKQWAPEGWPTELEALATRVWEYTKEVCDAFQEIGVQPSIISIGNEIRTGLLWPLGRTDNFANITRLLTAASWGVKDSTLSPQPKIMVHLDNGWNWGQQEWWYSNVIAAGFELDWFDQMGVSYYPFYNSDATMSSLRTSLNNMARTWGKEIVVAEINWPRSCPNPAHAFPQDLRDIGFSVEGQAEFTRRVAQVLEGIEGGKGTGLFYWEPAWLNNAALGSSCDANTLFEWPGTALSSLNVFSQI